MGQETSESCASPPSFGHPDPHRVPLNVGCEGFSAEDSRLHFVTPFTPTPSRTGQSKGDGVPCRPYGMQHARTHRRPTASSRCRLLQWPVGDIGAWSWDILWTFNGLFRTTSLHRRRAAFRGVKLPPECFPRLVVDFPIRDIPPFAARRLDEPMDSLFLTVWRAAGLLLIPCFRGLLRIPSSPGKHQCLWVTAQLSSLPPYLSP